MSSHFHFHNDRKLSSNTTNSSLPNQARLTICFQLPRSCLSFKLWKNATTVISPHFPFHDDRRLFYFVLSTVFLRIKKDWQLLCDRSKKTNQIFEERQIFLRSVRDLIRATEIKSRSLRFLAERQRFFRSVRDMYSRKKHASKKLSL